MTFPLVPEYEKKCIMDQAMADNDTYFRDFYKDLANRRFSLMVTAPLFVNFQDQERGFANENNAWVTGTDAHAKMCCNCTFT